MKTVWLALGSNLGDREAHLRQAIHKLGSPAFKVTRVSPVYETAPQGFLEQNWFFNLVLAAETSLAPLELLAHCEDVEFALKRQRSIANGPRTIDIDILFYAHELVGTPSLQVPHPRYHRRRFVLQPLADLIPDFQDPRTHSTVQELLAKVTDQTVRRTVIAITVKPS